MYSNKDAFKIEERGFDTEQLVSLMLKIIIEEYSLSCAILCLVSNQGANIKIVGTHGIPSSTLSASKKDLFSDTLKSCFKQYPKPHVHSIESDTCESFRKLVKSKISRRLLFIPLLYDNYRFVFLGFSKDSIESIPDNFCSSLSEIIVPIKLLMEARNLNNDLVKLETYVKEVGHDIASGIQAIVAKLSNIARGLYDQKAVKVKAQEAKEEIENIYGIAENLGFVVDPDYNIGKGAYFDIIKITNNSIISYTSEAREGHKEIIFEVDNTKIFVWGDEKGIENAIGQFIFNAIKYAFGSTRITIKIFESQRNVTVAVIDKGIPLDPEEVPYIWDFGVRGEKAYEKHVNGAGIGLFTVKKIIAAHTGSCNVRILPQPNLSEFSFTIPKKNIVGKTKLVK